MKRSESIAAIAAAIAKAQGAMKPLLAAETAKITSKSGASYSYRYANLAATWEVIREPLSSNGLCLVQMIDLCDTGLCIETMLAHESGEWISGIYPFHSSEDPKAEGSEITYHRRYAVWATLGLAPEDDDGDAKTAAKPAVKKEQEAAKQPTKEQNAAKPTQTAQAPPPDAHIQKLMKFWTRTKASGCTEADFRAYIKQQFGADSSKSLDEKRASFWEGQILQVEGEILKGLSLNMMAEIQPDQRDRALSIGKSAWAVILDASRHNQGLPEQGELLPPPDEIPGETPHYEPGELKKSRTRRGA